MCIVSNWVNEAQDLMAVTKYDDLPNSLIPTQYISGDTLSRIVPGQLDTCLLISTMAVRLPQTNSRVEVILVRSTLLKYPLLLC